VIELFSKYKQKTFSFLEKNAQTKYAEYWLMAVAFAESSFFPIPVDVLLIVMLMYGANKWVHYASLATVFSVLGGIFGYLIGALFFDVLGEFIINTYNLQDSFDKVSILFNSNTFWTVFVAAFTPIPYKVFTITAGVFNINFLLFVLASILGRGIRFFIVAFVMKVFGKKVLDIFMKYFNAITLGIVVIILLILIF